MAKISRITYYYYLWELSRHLNETRDTYFLNICDDLFVTFLRGLDFVMYYNLLWRHVCHLIYPFVTLFFVTFCFILWRLGLTYMFHLWNLFSSHLLYFWQLFPYKYIAWVTTKSSHVSYFLSFFIFVIYNTNLIQNTKLYNTNKLIFW